MSDKKDKQFATIAAVAAGVGIVGLTTWWLSKREDAVGQSIRAAFSPPRPSRSSHYSGARTEPLGYDEDAPNTTDPSLWAASHSNITAAEAEEWLQPNRFISDVLAPLAKSSSTGSVIAAVGGLGSRVLAHRIASQLRGCDVIATDPEPPVRHFLAARASREGLTNLTISPGGRDRVGLPAGVRANVLLFAGVLGPLSDRPGYLRRSAAIDLVPGGFMVVLDFKPGRLPIPAPPELERLERSTIMADAEAAGLELISAPAILDCFNILVFQAPGRRPSDGRPLLYASPSRAPDSK